MNNLPSDYPQVLEKIKEQIIDSRHRVAMAVNSRLIFLYWQIGKHIVNQQEVEGWGSGVIRQLSTDLNEAFPEMRGISPRNLDYMRQMAREWPEKLLIALSSTEDPIALKSILLRYSALSLEVPAITQQPAAKLQASDSEEVVEFLMIKDRENPITQQAAAQLEEPINDTNRLNGASQCIDIDRLVTDFIEGAEAIPITQQPAAKLEWNLKPVVSFDCDEDIQCSDNEYIMSDMPLPESPAEFAQQPAAKLNDQDEIKFEAFEKLALGRIPWSHHMTLLDKLKFPRDRWFYCEKIVANGWSRKVLLHQLDLLLHLNQGSLTHNFSKTLPHPQSELVQDVFKDHYIFDFLQIRENIREKELEDLLIRQITEFLLELGSGFSFIAQQYRLEVGGKEFIIDLLFYHIHLRRYVAIELKIGEFLPEYVGKLQFYLAVLDDQKRTAYQEPSIGLILCKEANRIVAEYALRDSSSPIGVAGYKLSQALPNSLAKALPSIEQLEKRLSKGKGEH